MPIFVGLLLQGMYLVVSSVVGQWLFGLGVGFISYTGFTALSGTITAAVVTSLGGLSADLVQIVHLMGLMTALNIVLSGVAARWAIAGAGSATVKRLAFH